MIISSQRIKRLLTNATEILEKHTELDLPQRLSPAVCLKYTSFHSLSKSILCLDVRCMFALHVHSGRLRKLTRLECPLRCEDFRVECVFIGGPWQEEAGTWSRITEQQWNAVQRGIS